MGNVVFYKKQILLDDPLSLALSDFLTAFDTWISEKFSITNDTEGIEDKDRYEAIVNETFYLLRGNTTT